MGKILLYLSIALSIGTAVVGFINHGTLATTKDELAASQSSLEQTKSSSAKTDAELKKTQGDLATLTAEKESLTANLTASNQKAASAEAKVAEQTVQLTQKDAQITQLETDNKAKDTRIADLETKSNPAGEGANNQLTELQNQLAEKEALIVTLQAKEATQKAQIADLTQKEVDRQKLRMRDGLEGRVLAVNPAWNFVVLSLGDRNGVVNNAEMLVKRGSQLVGKVKVTSVEPSSSIADIVSNPSGNVTIQPGDNVIFKSSE